MARRKSGTQNYEYLEHLELQVVSITLCKLVGDYMHDRLIYKECTEMYFQEWLNANFYTWSSLFEKVLFMLFMQALLKGDQSV